MNTYPVRNIPDPFELSRSLNTLPSNQAAVNNAPASPAPHSLSTATTATTTTNTTTTASELSQGILPAASRYEGTAPCRAELEKVKCEIEALRRRVRELERTGPDPAAQKEEGGSRHGGGSGTVEGGGEEEKQEEMNAQPVVNGREKTRIEATAVLLTTFVLTSRTLR